ncbi:MAG: hypothetical protein KZQ88_06405 [Candidatus Thiodiazotropha sp. (ex Dulcina madagascariensis)]|nr:hypothetical protein [Candidatus Thiodiazotropha sp. (ex Dulcina madagascariensis)]MCU7928556.1 hypothetical protein [Candidatus Thiodiazotropha sp. (ex Dulcina madagascariensis)]
MIIEKMGFFLLSVLCLLTPALSTFASPGATGLGAFEATAAHYPGKSAVYVLEKGEESLLARAWLAESAKESIDVQYFIWSTDNIGTLASEALLSAASRCGSSWTTC